MVLAGSCHCFNQSRFGGNFGHCSLGGVGNEKDRINHFYFIVYLGSGVFILNQMVNG